MQIVNNLLKPISKGLVSGCKTVVNTSIESKNTAERAGKLQHLTPTQINIAKGKGLINGAFKPLIGGLTDMSPNFQTLINTYKKVQRNMKIAVNKAVEENPDASKTKAKIQGIKKSKLAVKSAINEIVGINDIDAAIEKSGEKAGIKEAGKAMVRLTSSLSLFVAGNFVPIPGMSGVGWIAGEKLTELIFGKPFTKQAKNILPKK